MALVLKDRVRESSSTSGTGTITLSGAATGFDSFASIGDGNTTYYAIIDTIAGDWEVGLGTYTASGTTLSRDTVLESSNSDTLVNFAANTKDVICTYPADKSVFLAADGSLSLPGALSATGAVTGSNLNVSNWDTAYGWGNHAIAGYVVADGAVVINESGANVDFRIESDTDVNAFFLEGSNGNVGIGRSSPVNFGADWTGLEVAGKTTSSGGVFRVSTSDASSVGDLYIDSNQYTLRTATNHPLVFQTNAAERMRITASGNVGIGTSLPSYKAEIDSGSLGTSLNDRLDALRLATNTSNVDTLNFSKIRTSAGTDWTTAGWRLQQRVDAVNMGYIQFNGDSNNYGISFGRDDSTEHMRINSSGNVGIGTASPSTKLDVNGAVTIDGIRLEDSSDRSGLLEINRVGSTSYTGTQARFSSTSIWSFMGGETLCGIYDDSNSDWALQYSQNAGLRLYYAGAIKLNTTSSGVSVTGSLTASGDVTAYSDERLKENWKDLPEGFVESLAGVKSGTYNRIDLDGKQQVGVSAQSLQTVLPDAVIELNDTLTVNYGNAALASAIELAKKVVELEARIKELEVK